jgi:hypothetical protein
MATTGAKTAEFERILLNYLFDDGAAPMAGTENTDLYIGLVTGDPAVNDNAASAWHSTHEVAASAGYSRVRLTAASMNAASTAAGDPFATTIDNVNEINFGTSTVASWGDVTGFIIATSSVIAETGTYYYGIFDTPKSVADGDSVRITAGNLSIEER